jgi:carboxylesterase type B
LPGNLGLWDILLALKWVQINVGHFPILPFKNICSPQKAHVFGGDPNNVMLMGQGSGASAASILALSPKANGCFYWSKMDGIIKYFEAFSTK